MGSVVVETPATSLNLVKTTFYNNNNLVKGQNKSLKNMSLVIYQNCYTKKYYSN